MSEERKRILNMLANGKISADEAEELLDALGTSGAPGASGNEETGGTVARKLPKYLRVKVVSADDDNVNVRVPLALLRSGLKLTSVMPPWVAEKVNSSMSEKGIPFDLNNLKKEDLNELIDSLAETEVNVDSKNGDNVKVYCE